RKLQQEIDRVFKRVNEGLATFTAIYDKFTYSEIPAQREKLESDLKREIKKLQRFRDQIKTWLSGNEVKDKKPLIEHRKLIEYEMERFKEVEKGMKIKSFSNEGLSMDLDPRQKLKHDACTFVQDSLEELEKQADTLEGQVDQLQAAVKKTRRDAAKQEQIAAIDEILQRNHWHQGRLEQVLKMLENSQLEPEQISEIQDDIQYFVESNQDPDFADDEGIYDELNLREIEEVGPEVVEAPKDAPPGLAPYAQKSLRSNTATPRVSTVLPSRASTPAPPGLSRQPTLMGTPLTGPVDPQPAPGVPVDVSTSLSNLLPALTAATKRLTRPQTMDEIKPVLENSLLNCPDSFDSEKPRLYKPSKPHPTPTNYPQEPLVDLLSGSQHAIFRKIDESTLFYLFYYNAGEYLQYIAAKELMTRGWLFHRELKTWFLKD
ncbi:hypothetical protein BABINDRAFT_23510, partial [Babjeviella inositovora NRRL Y-12698]